DAAGALEERQPALLLLGEGRLVALKVEVKGRAGRDERALERRDGPREVVERQRVVLAWEGLLEERLVAGLAQALDGLLGREVHLDVRLDGALGLLLERRRAAVPELGRQEGRVEDGRAVARTRARALA